MASLDTLVNGDECNVTSLKVDIQLSCLFYLTITLHWLCLL